MTLQPRVGTGFNVSDDEFFAGLLSHHVLGTGNSLINVKPSSLNLTGNCWSTLDLQIITYNGTQLDETLRLQYLTNALKPVFPGNGPTASVLDIGDYWSAIAQIPSTPAVLKDVEAECYSSGGFFVPSLDFQADCSTTGLFWWLEIFTHPALRLQGSDVEGVWASLFQGSLPKPFSNMTASTIAAIAGLVQNSTDITPPNVSSAQLQSQFDAAAVVCSQPACEALDYDGSADVAGLGVSIL